MGVPAPRPEGPTMRKVLHIVSASLLAACVSKPPADPTTGVWDGTQPDGTPGSEAWGAEDITCMDHGDCNTGESCLNEVCQPAQCQGGLADSAAPIGSTFTFFADNEIGIADRQSYDGGYWVDTYSPYATTTDYDGSTEISATALVDISGGRFLKGERRAQYVAAIEGRSAFGFSTSRGYRADDVDWMTLAFQPAALDVGDTDADGLDEVVVVSFDGKISNCHLDTASCESWTFDADIDMDLIDVAAGDIDGDAVDEIVALIDMGGDTLVYVMNQDYEGKDQPMTYQGYVDDAIRLDVGDLDGDRIDEIAVLRDVNSIPLWGENDAIEVYSVVASSSDDEVGEISLLADQEADDLKELQDIEIADTDADMIAEIFVVDSSRKLAAYDMDYGNIYERFNQTLSVASEPFRLALTDTDGDSPQATLVDDEPILAKGAPIPSAMILMPPYDADHSKSPSSSFYGSSESTSETYSDTVSLGMKVDIGVKAEFMDMFGASYGASMGWRVRQTYGESFRTSVGERFGMSADPDMYGPYHGAVVLYWGCFDTYTYEIDDPNGLAADMDGENFVITVPVGGSTSVWSLARYNAMAQALGTLPVLEVPYAVGNVDDYPSAPERIDGTPIPEEDMVFKDPNWYTSPDVGSVSYRSQYSTDESTATSFDTSIGTSAGVTAAGIQVGIGTEYGWGEGYRLSLGTAAMFSGRVAAVPDNPSTPEDEYNLYAFRFAPVVYRHWYTNPMGDEAALFVMTYAAER